MHERAFRLYRAVVAVTATSFNKEDRHCHNNGHRHLHGISVGAQAPVAFSVTPATLPYWCKGLRLVLPGILRHGLRSHLPLRLQRHSIPQLLRSARVGPTVVGPTPLARTATFIAGGRN